LSLSLGGHGFWLLSAPVSALWKSLASCPVFGVHFIRRRRYGNNRPGTDLADVEGASIPKRLLA
jgi:hypothetical protein